MKKLRIHLRAQWVRNKKMVNPFLDPKKKIYKRTGEEAYQDYLDRLANGGDEDGDESDDLPPGAKDLDDLIDSPSKITRKGDVYVITNLTLFDLQGSPVKVYSEVELDASPVLGADGKPIKKSQPDWIAYYKEKNKKLPSLPLLYAIIEAAYDNQKNNDVAEELLESLKTDFKPSWLVTSTRFNYSQDKIWHDFESSEQIEITQNIPGIEEYLEKLVQEQEWEEPLRTIFMTKNLQKIPEVLGVYGIKGKLRTPDSDRETERAAFAGFSFDYFAVICYNFLNDCGRSRGVYTSAAGAKKNRPYVRN